MQGDKKNIILTHSDIAFNAVRIAVKRNNFKDAYCHQVKNDGTVCISKIFPNGQMKDWLEGVFTTWENQLLELL